MLSSDEIREFRANLLTWFRVHQRDLPWRRTREPYAIWISEIMLQQTRVAAVIPFFHRFLRRFPDCSALAEAPESDLLACWAGLGYYSRARNLQRAAQAIHASGAFPQTHEAILALPGVGDYTAAAVASIGFGLPHAAVDGNVLRVLSRILADGTDIASAAGRKRFASAAEQMLARSDPGAFNQAMMELGATICLPKNPQCLVCPVSRVCRARQQGRQREFPVKLAKSKTVEATRTLFWIEHEGSLLLWQRPPDSRLMPGFWELPESAQVPSASAGHLLGTFRHGITFHKYRFEVREAETPRGEGPYRFVSLAALGDLPLSTVVRKAMRVVARFRSGRTDERAIAAAS